MSVTVVVMNQTLRLNDNRALALASDYGDPILPMVIFPHRLWNKQWFLYPSMGPHRQSWLVKALLGLEKNIQENGGQLWASNEDPKIALQRVFQSMNVQRVIGTCSVGHYEKQMEADVDQISRENKVNVEWVWDHTLHHPKTLPFSMLDTPNSFSKFRKYVEKLPIEAPIINKAVSFVNNQAIPTVMNTFVLRKKNLPTGTLSELDACAHLQTYIWESKAILHYKNTRNLSIGDHVSTKFSVWLSLGIVSARTIAHEIKLFEKNVKKNSSTYWVIFELLWRDFFQFQCEKYGIRWYQFGGIQGLENAPPTYDENAFNAWRTGQTPEPFVNAHMKELITTGYMSNRGRQVVASYLIHNLNQDWRRGAEVFEHYLIDYDVASNIGNWMYIAGCGNSQTKRIFNIQNQQEKYDPGQKYVNKWL